MTKVSEVRSAIRRMALVKAAAAGNELSAIYADIASKHRPGIPQAGYNQGAAALAARPRPKPVQQPVAQPVRPAPQPRTQYSTALGLPANDAEHAARMRAAYGDQLVAGLRRFASGIKPVISGIVRK